MDERTNTNAAVHAHLRAFFAGHACQEHVWTLGPAIDEMPHLQVLEFAPGTRSPLWVYASAGAWAARPDPQLEFVLAAAKPDLRHVELLFMAAWYHGRRGLGVGHTVPLGEPWLSGSTCDHYLVSLPYPFGPELEGCELPDGHLHILWLLPITAAERAFKVREGQEALEQQFDAHGLRYWIADRPSVVVESA
ncbi:MAG: suppressor of fused domain protein [Gemmataceae bacterium]|nr:suppressor of fused domain protein [Gemmataceae bacterium]